MRNVRQKGTKKELEIRSALHKLGMRFRVQVAPLEGVRRHADIVFRGKRVAIFVDGCFWHGCPLHRTLPKSNTEWWKAKLEENIRRDNDTNARLGEAGWLVLRFWEHEDAEQVAQDIQHRLRERHRQS
jgi:DNA mismatch endonuclease (patch repair protein)